MAADDEMVETSSSCRLLEPGTRLLHIGPHKTGTTAVQDAFHLARERLPAHGVVYPGEGRQPLEAVLAVTGQPALLGEPSPGIAQWIRLVRDVCAAGDQRVVVSSEFFAGADDNAARRVLADLGGPRVHVVVTLRPLAKIMPSQWQQYLQNGYCFPYPEWLAGILSEPPHTPTPGFWLRHRHDKLITRWAAAAGAQNLTVIVVDEADPSMLLRTFESLLGLPRGLLAPGEGAGNRSLTLAEAEVVRLVNQEFKRQGWPERSYARFLRYGAIEQLKTARQPLPEEPKIVTPQWALERAAEIGAEMADNISALGVGVIGDISVLGRAPAGPQEAAADTEPAVAAVPAEAAAHALIGAFTAAGVVGPAAVPDRLVREVDAKQLAAVLVTRARQRVRTTLRLPHLPPGGMSGRRHVQHTHADL
jgi:hypothetical protein